MSKYCSTCDKNYEDYLRYCPVCMRDLTYLYDRQDILDNYEKELDETLQSLSDIDNELYSLKEKLEKANNQDAIIDLKFKITKLNEKKTPLENKVNEIRKKINSEEKLKKEILNEIKSKEKLYMNLYVEIDDDKVALLNNDKKFKNKSKDQIIDYLMKNCSEIEINNLLSGINRIQKDKDLFYKDLYVNLNDQVLNGLCEYFSISFTSKEEVLKKIIDEYSRNAILNAIESVLEDIELEIERKEFYDKLMRTFTPTDVSLFCRKFDIENPSKHKIIDYLVENFTEDEIDFMKIELHNEYEIKIKKERLFEKLVSTLTDDDVQFLADELNLNNRKRNDIITYLVENFSESEINSKLEKKFNFYCTKILKSLKEFDGSNFSIDLKNQAIDWYNKGKNGNSGYADFYNHVNKILKEELSCSNTPNLNTQMRKIVLQFEFNKDINIVSQNTGISENKIKEWYLKGKSGNLVYKSFYTDLHHIMPSFNPDRNINKNSSDAKGSVSEKPVKVKYHSPKKHDSNDDELLIMNGVLKALKQGKSRYEACELADIKPSKISQWYNQGKNKKSENTIYFYNELRKIESNKKSLTTDTYSVIKRNNDKKTKTFYSLNDVAEVSSKDSSGSKLVYPSDIRGSGRNTSSGSKLVYPSDIRGSGRNTSSDDKFVNPSDVSLAGQSNHKRQSRIKDNSKDKTFNRNSRKDMLNIISLMKKGYTRKEAAVELGIDYNLVIEWYDNGFKNRERYARNFFKQVRAIESENKQKKSRSSNNKSKQKNNSSLKPFKPVRSLPDNIFKSNSSSDKTDAIIKKNSVLKDMNKVLSYMRKGDNRIQASRKSNVNIGQINTWYTQGSKNHDDNTFYFYNEVKKIESKKL